MTRLILCSAVSIILSLAVAYGCSSRSSKPLIPKDAQDPWAYESKLHSVLEHDDGIGEYSVIPRVYESGKAIVPLLIKELSDPYVNRKAVTNLGAIGPDAVEAVPALIELLNDNWEMEIFCVPERLSYTAVRAISEIGPAAVPALIEGLKHKDEYVRGNVCQELSGFHPKVEGIIPILSGMTADESEYVRRAVADSLGSIDISDALPVLSQMMEDESESVRGAAVKNIGGFSGASVVPYLVKGLGDKDASVRRIALDWDWSATPGPYAESAVPYLVYIIQHDSKLVKEDAINALGKIGPAAKDAVPLLIEILKDGIESFRVDAARALGGIGPPAAEAVPFLVDKLRTDVRDVKRECAEALGKIGVADDDVISALRNAMEPNEHAWVQNQAALALGKLGPPALPALINALGDEHGQIRERAAEGLKEMGIAAKDAETALIKSLQDPNPEVRRYCAKALGSIGRESPAAVAALRGLINDKDFWVRAAAAEGLGMAGSAAKEAIPDLLKALTDKSGMVRSQSALALHLIDPSVIDAVGFLVKELASHDLEARAAAAFALGVMGADAADALPELRELGKREKEGLPGFEARTAVGKIEADVAKSKKQDGE